MLQEVINQAKAFLFLAKKKYDVNEPEDAIRLSNTGCIAPFRGRFREVGDHRATPEILKHTFQIAIVFPWKDAEKGMYASEVFFFSFDPEVQEVIKNSRYCVTTEPILLNNGEIQQVPAISFSSIDRYYDPDGCSDFRQVHKDTGKLIYDENEYLVSCHDQLFPDDAPLFNFANMPSDVAICYGNHYYYYHPQDYYHSFSSICTDSPFQNMKEADMP